MKASMGRDTRKLWDVFRAPLVVGVLSLAGLIAALVGDGPWDLLGCLALLPAVAWSVTGVWRAWPRQRTRGIGSDL